MTEQVMNSRAIRALVAGAVLAWALAASTNAQAQVLAPQTQTVPLGEALQSVVVESGSQCPRMAAALQREKGKQDAMNFWLLEQYQDSLCQCQPATIQALLAQRPASELARQVSQGQAMDYLMTHVTSRCLGKVFRELFGGKQCNVFLDPATCACMASEVRGMGDMEILQGGAAYHQYRKARADSRAAGKPDPALPPEAASLAKLTERCSKTAR